MQRNRFREIVVAFCVIICCQVGNAQNGYPTGKFEIPIQKATQFLDSLKKAQNIPSISIAVGVNGKLVWKEAFGLANMKDGAKANTETIYRVDSISKPMTALGLAVLYEQGKIDFDDPVDKYIPQFKEKKHPVTIRQLAGHQGGIRHYKGFEFLSNKQYSSVEKGMSIFIDDPLQSEPGTEYLYSTYGYVALSRIIEVASGKNYLEFMRSQVFDPLGMMHTVAEDAGMDESATALYYNKNGKKEVGDVNLSAKWAGGGFLSTPEDLVNMVNGASKIISVQTLMMMTRPQSLKNGQVTEYGMGWRYSVAQSNKREIIHHGGTSAGARAFLLVLPVEQIVVALCVNSEAEYNAQEVYTLAKLFINHSQKP